ncbi:hypothetical protein DSO57_1023347 [Entomophthora muscae]|uniref:Uncharacterized protein n=1 Tax=Entomophthora muscae TaxID=34485 RepID=A0ACC2RHP0_9FUNG|nr:hypothetical protein DSO57_1023347 [Entomophthora muscae]
MTPPLTPQPDHLLEPTAAAETTSTQLFGVLYITLTGLVDSMVPNSGPWSLLGQSHPFYGGPYPPAQLYLILSHPRPLPTTGFLTIRSLAYQFQLSNETPEFANLFVIVLTPATLLPPAFLLSTCPIAHLPCWPPACVFC